MDVDSEGFYIIECSDSSDVPLEIGTTVPHEELFSDVDPDPPDDEPSLPGFSFPKRKPAKPSAWDNLVVSPGDVKSRPIVKRPVEVESDDSSDEVIGHRECYRILAQIENTPRQKITLGKFEWNAEGECLFPRDLRRD